MALIYLGGEYFWGPRYEERYRGREFL